MIKRLFIVTTVIAMMLSACSGQTTAETAAPASTDTPVPPITEVPATTETSATLLSETPAIDISGATPTETAIPGTPLPTNAPDCINSASFVADLTIPDNTSVGGGTTFTKTWRVRNTGTCIWGPDYTLTHYSEEAMGAPASVPLGVTFPGQALDIAVELTAPNTIGTHRGNFVIKNPAGLIMKVDEDSRVWVIINVTSPAAASPTATSATANASPTGTSAGSGGTSTAGGACAFSTDRAKLTGTINAVNAYRAQNGLPPYTVNMLLARAAQAHADDMACNKLFVHTGSDGSTPQSRVAATGYTGSSVTENVYASYPPLTGQGVVNWWINDRTDVRHNQNLLSNTYTEIGVGYSFFDNYGYYVLVFAKP